MKKINEIFYSLQGEGLNAGTAAVFVRFSGCNVKCPFCDTKHQDGVMMSDDEIVTEVAKYPSELVVFTGGEPTLQLDDKLCLELKKIGKTIAIETNGTRPAPKSVDFITLSPKFEQCPDAKLNNFRMPDELKVVFDMESNMELYEKICAMEYFIQPCDTGDKELNKKIVERAVNYCKDNPKWRLSLQTQKIINIQ
jgi:organic radical activating enzyme